MKRQDDSPVIAEAERLIEADSENGRANAVAYIEGEIARTTDREESLHFRAFRSSVLMHMCRYEETAAECMAIVSDGEGIMSPSWKAKTLRRASKAYRLLGNDEEATRVHALYMEADKPEANINRKYGEALREGDYRSAAEQLVIIGNAETRAAERRLSEILRLERQGQLKHPAPVVLNQLMQNLEAMCEESPQDVGCLHALARVYKDMGMSDAAVIVLEQGLLINPNHVPTLEALRPLYQRSDPRGLDLARRLYEIDPDSIQHATVVAAEYLRKKQPDAAARVLEPVYENNPSHTGTFGLLVLSYMRSRNYRAVNALLEKAPESPTTIRLRMASTFLQHDHKRAAELATQILETSTDSLAAKILEIVKQERLAPVRHNGASSPRPGMHAPHRQNGTRPSGSGLVVPLKQNGMATSGLSRPLDDYVTEAIEIELINGALGTSFRPVGASVFRGASSRTNKAAAAFARSGPRL